MTQEAYKGHIGPYVVTAKRVTVDDMPDDSRDTLVSRCAVATLDEAHEAARELSLYASGTVQAIAQCVRDIFAITESGGSVTLPDGSTIEVQPTTYYDLQRARVLASLNLAPKRCDRQFEARPFKISLRVGTGEVEINGLTMREAYGR